MELVDVEIAGDIRDVTINGVDVGPYVEAELDRRDPDRAKMRPTDVEGFREAWDVLEGLWDGTVERARRLDPELLQASVDGEWSFIETVRHLAFATDAWVRRAILRDPAPRSFAVRECLSIVLSEEWEHRSYAERDLPPWSREPADCAARRSWPYP